MTDQGKPNPSVSFDNSYARLPDRFFVRVAPTRAPNPKLLALNHSLAERLGLADALHAMSDAELAALLREKSPAASGSGGYFLVDPLGNLVMYFEPGIDPGDMVDDIKRLLKLSRIG